MPPRSAPLPRAVESVSWRDLAAQDASLRTEIRSAVDEVLRSGRYVGGPVVEAFERALAASVGVSHAVGVNSGTDALVLILRAAGIGPGDEVIVPTFTFIATPNAVALAGATPVFADTLADGFCVDPVSVEAARSPRTRAVIAVHLFGEPADLDALGALCARHGLMLIEDAAQAFGATHRARAVGSVGAAAAFSFYPTKNLGAAGDGGAVATSDAALAAKVRALANHGGRPGTNSRLDALQSAILRVKLPHVERWNETRRSLAGAYRERLAGTRAHAPAPAPHVRHVYHQFVIAHPVRDALRAHLAQRGIPTQVYYETPCHCHPAYAQLSGVPLDRADAWSRTALALPIYPELPASAIDTIGNAIVEFDRK